MTVARRTPTRLPRERREHDILAAARAVFCERGYAEAGVAEIAARAQVVEGTLYKYFDSKRVLLERVLEGWYEGLLADYARHLPGSPAHARGCATSSGATCARCATIRRWRGWSFSKCARTTTMPAPRCMR